MPRIGELACGVLSAASCLFLLARLLPYLSQIHHVQLSMKEELMGLDDDDMDAQTIGSLQRDSYLARGSVALSFTSEWEAHPRELAT